MLSQYSNRGLCGARTRDLNDDPRCFSWLVLFSRDAAPGCLGPFSGAPSSSPPSWAGDQSNLGEHFQKVVVAHH